MNTITEKQEAINELKKMLKPGDKVYTILRHVSASGMQRQISVVIPLGRNGIRNLDWYVEKILGLKRNMKHEGVVINGIGMDMGFEIVYRLSAALYPDGFKVDMVKTTPRNGDTSGWDNDGGYALKHEWI